MAKFARAAITIAFTAIGGALGGPIGAAIGSFIGAAIGTALLPPSAGRKRQASATEVQLGEVPREAIVGRAVTAGSLVDVFNYGGKYGTDWEVLVLALADHRCDALEGFYVNDGYVAFGADGNVAGYNSQLQVYWRSGTELQSVPAILTTNGPGWTANDNGAGVAYVVVAYKADAADAKNPVWPGGRPRFRWVVRGLRAYDARLDSSVGGAGAQRWNDPATRVWSDNPIVQRYTWARGIYACDRVGDPAQLLIGRGLSATEAPPANVFARANLCDELVGGAKRYRSGGIISAGESFLEVEEDFAAACAGIITQPQGSVEIDPGEARAVVATFTDDDLLVGSKVRWNKGMLSAASDEWVNTVVARYVEPSLGWAEHAAPVRRDPADITADGASREQAVSLGFVSHGAQAGRIAEIIRRLGRLWGRAEVTLGPRWSFIAEGDWVAWQSARHFGGATRTFRVDAWRSDRAWHHGLTLRQISASAYSDTAPLDDGSIAAPSPVPPAIGAPSGAAWALAAGYQAAGDLRTPVLVVTGLSDDPAARFIRVEYVAGTAPITGATVWSDAGVTGPDVQRREIPVAAGGTYRVGISYVVDSVPGDRLVLGPVVAGPVTYADGTPVADLQPAEGGATSGADWGTNLTSRPAELTDGRVSAGLSSDGSQQQGVYGGGAVSVGIVAVMEASLLGKSLSLDADFSLPVIPSNFAIYNNRGGDDVTMALVTDASAPNGSGRVLRVSYDGGGTVSPGYGGIVQSLLPTTGVSRPGVYSPGTRVLYAIRAKIPVGRSIDVASNNLGNGASLVFLTPRGGTGVWATYLVLVTIGATSTPPFSSTGFIYVAGGANTAFSWDIALYDQRELGSQELPQLARLVDPAGVIRAATELVTAQGTAAAITGQSPLAAGNSLTTSDVTNSLLAPSIADAATRAQWLNVTSRPTTLGALDSAAGTKLGGIETGADVTAGKTAAAIAGQSPLAAGNSLTTSDVTNSLLAPSIAAAAKTALWGGVSGRPGSLSDLDAAAAAQLTSVAGGGPVTVGYGQVIKHRLANGASRSFAAACGVNAGGNNGTLRCRIQVSVAGANSWSSVAQGGGVSVGPGEPGQDTVSGAWTNSTGSEQLFDFRVIDARTPGTAGGTINNGQTWLSG